MAALIAIWAQLRLHPMQRPPPPRPPSWDGKGCFCTSRTSYHNLSDCIQVAFEMDAISVAAVTATRPAAPGAGTPIPPTDLLVLHSPAKLSLYVASRHVCDIRLRVPGLESGFPPYSSFLRGSQAIPKEAESPGEYSLCSSITLLLVSLQCRHHAAGGVQVAGDFNKCGFIELAA